MRKGFKVKAKKNGRNWDESSGKRKGIWDKEHSVNQWVSPLASTPGCQWSDPCHPPLHPHLSPWPPSAPCMSVVSECATLCYISSILAMLLTLPPRSFPHLAVSCLSFKTNLQITSSWKCIALSRVEKVQPFHSIKELITLPPHLTVSILRVKTLPLASLATTFAT